MLYCVGLNKVNDNGQESGYFKELPDWDKIDGALKGGPWNPEEDAGEWIQVKDDVSWVMEK
jgi:hypothetical protein